VVGAAGERDNKQRSPGSAHAGNYRRDPEPGGVNSNGVRSRRKLACPKGGANFQVGLYNGGGHGSGSGREAKGQKGPANPANPKRRSAGTEWGASQIEWGRLRAVAWGRLRREEREAWGDRRRRAADATTSSPSHVDPSSELLGVGDV
jgi:hypothetical protein